MFLPYRLKYLIWLKKTTRPSMVPCDGYLNAHFASRRKRILLTYLHPLGSPVSHYNFAGHLIQCARCS
jgi:hypothetical protein